MYVLTMAEMKFKCFLFKRPFVKSPISVVFLYKESMYFEPEPF